MTLEHYGAIATRRNCIHNRRGRVTDFRLDSITFYEWFCVCVIVYVNVGTYMCVSCGSLSGCSCTVRQAKVHAGWRNTPTERRHSSWLMMSTDQSISTAFLASNDLLSKATSKPSRSLSILRKLHHFCSVLKMVSDELTTVY